jgi:formate hydrogenlyase subunit 6/NADH:ubiquinone oxidoreductase subunit I
MTLKSGSESGNGTDVNFAISPVAGAGFRAKAASRLRHRIYRKAKWIKEREGIAGCVGCARCDRACTAHINSVEIYNQLAEEG